MGSVCTFNASTLFIAELSIEGFELLTDLLHVFKIEDLVFVQNLAQLPIKHIPPDLSGRVSRNLIDNNLDGNFEYIASGAFGLQFDPLDDEVSCLPGADKIHKK